MKKLLTLFAFTLLAFTGNAQSCPDNKHPHAIDLGLQTGTKWACCNVGAGKPEAYGGYYAWGEVQEKSVYDWDTYQYWIDNNGDGDWDSNEFTNLGSDIAGTQYDVAHAKWGGSWVMPTSSQFYELFNRPHEMTTINGVYGLKITVSNGGSIFFPAAGFQVFNQHNYQTGHSGHYWSSTQYSSDLSYAYEFVFSSTIMHVPSNGRSKGNTVRPVISGTTDINLPESFSNASNHAVYNLYGIKVADNSADMNTLPPGIYILNGKKIVIK